MSDETTQPIGGDAEQPTGGADARFTQADLDRVDARNRRKMNEMKTQLEQMQAKDAERAESQKSDEQKRLDAAIKAKEVELNQHYTAQMSAKEINAELRVKLIEAGYDPDLAHIVKAKGEIASVDDIPQAITDALGSKDWARARIQGQAGKPTPPAKDGLPRTLEEYHQFISTHPQSAITQEIADRGRAMIRGEA